MVDSTNCIIATRALFGGAIRLDLPARLVDASALRAVPDNQEVFAAAPPADAPRHAPSPLSLVVEVLERVAAAEATAAAAAAASDCASASAAAAAGGAANMADADAGGGGGGNGGNSEEEREGAAAAAFLFRNVAEESEAAEARLEAVRRLALPRAAPRAEPRAAGAGAWRAHGVQRLARGGGAAEDVLVLLGVLRLPVVATDLVFTLYAVLPGGAAGAAGAAARAEAEGVFARVAETLEVLDFGLFAAA